MIGNLRKLNKTSQTPQYQTINDPYQDLNFIAADSTNSKVFNNIGIAYFQTGRMKDAKIAFKKALEINPGNAEVHFNYGLSMKRELRYKEALEHFEAANSIVKDQPQIIFNIAFMQYLLKQNKQAIEGFRYYLEKFPRDKGSKKAKAILDSLTQS